MYLYALLHLLYRLKVIFTDSNVPSRDSIKESLGSRRKIQFDAFEVIFNKILTDFLATDFIQFIAIRYLC